MFDVFVAVHVYCASSVPLQVPVRWTAPEALELRQYSCMSDCWSFGVILYEMWTKAATPYDGMSNQKVWTAVLGGYRLPQPADCPDHVYALMLECWATTPTDRPAMLDLWQQFRELEDKLRTDLRRAKSYRLPTFIKDDTPVDEHIYVDFTSGSESIPDLYDASEQAYSQFKALAGKYRHRQEWMFSGPAKGNRGHVFTNASYIKFPTTQSDKDSNQLSELKLLESWEV